MRARALGRLLGREEAGQMAVELAVLMPVVIVAALVAFNVMRAAELCARFDRVALDAVLAQGVSATGSSGELSGVAETREAIEQAMGNLACEIDVRSEDISQSAGGATVSLAAATTRFVCTLSYRPWPSSLEIAGVGYRLPAVFTHERSIVVDRWRAAVVT